MSDPKPISIALTPGEAVLGARDGWTLVERPHAHRDPWISLRLIRTDPRGPGRRLLWLGACPERMARHADMTWLIRHRPDLAVWVEGIATARAAALFRRAGDEEWMRRIAYAVETRLMREEDAPNQRSALIEYGTGGNNG